MSARHSNILFVSSGSVSLRFSFFFKHLDDKKNFCAPCEDRTHDLQMS